MNCYENMAALMRPLGLYDLRGGTLVDAELRAYACALQALADAQDAMLADALPQTATADGLAGFEALYGLGSQQSVEEGARRDMALYAGAVQWRDFNVAGVTKSLGALGASAKITEFYAPEEIQVEIDGCRGAYPGRDAMLDSLSRVLPAHLAVKYLVRFTSFDMLDQAGLNFDQADASGRSFDGWETYGYSEREDV